MKEDYAVVYTLSDHGDMIGNCLKSLRTLSRFVDRDNIIVFYTPPRTKHNLEKLSKYGTVVEAKNITKPFIAKRIEDVSAIAMEETESSTSLLQDQEVLQITEPSITVI